MHRSIPSVPSVSHISCAPCVSPSFPVFLAFPVFPVPPFLSRTPLGPSAQCPFHSSLSFCHIECACPPSYSAARSLPVVVAAPACVRPRAHCSVHSFSPSFLHSFFILLVLVSLFCSCCWLVSFPCVLLRVPLQNSSPKMARGPIKHMKRLNAPKHWMLGKLGGIWVRPFIVVVISAYQDGICGLLPIHAPSRACLWVVGLFCAVCSALQGWTWLASPFCRRSHHIHSLSIFFPCWPRCCSMYRLPDLPLVLTSSENASPCP